MRRSSVDVDELLLEGAELAGLQDGVAAQGDDHGLCGRAHVAVVRARPAGLLHRAPLCTSDSRMHRRRGRAERLAYEGPRPCGRERTAAAVAGLGMMGRRLP